MRATTTIPVVMVNVADPVGSGLVASLAHPGGNVTGVSALETELQIKGVELLHAVVPRATRMAVLSAHLVRDGPRRVRVGAVGGAAPQVRRVAAGYDHCVDIRDKAIL